MKSFLVKLVAFIIPLGILFLFPVTVVLLGREYISYKDVVSVQEKAPNTLFGFAYNGASFYMYKKQLVETKNPEVIALGTSRVMQFRKEFFNASTTFVNAGGAGKSMEDVENFIQILPENGNTKIIILGLDKEILISSYSLKEERDEDVLPVRFAKIVIPMSRRIYLDYFSGEFSLRDLINVSENSHNVGISALLHENGFRSDGSYRYGGFIGDSLRFAHIESSVRKVSKIIMGTHDSEFIAQSQKRNFEVNLKALERILVLAKSKNITIIGFTPPYPTEIYKARVTNDEIMGYINKRISDLFSENHVSLFNFSSINIFDGRDSEFVDAIHGTDVMYLRMMIYMEERINSLNNYSNILVLKGILKRTNGDFLDF